MARLSHDIEYVAARIGVAIARSLSPAQADHFGAGLGGLAYYVMASRRRVALDNITRALADEIGHKECQRMVSEVFRNTGRSLIDLARTGEVYRHSPERLFVSGDIDQMRRVHDEGKGGLLVSGHFGSFELWGVWIAIQGFPANFLTGIQSNLRINDLINGYRSELGVGVIPADQSAREVMRALRRNEFVAMLPDQHSPAGIAVDFFGRPAATARGAAVFSIRSGAPILPMMLRRERYDRHVVMAGEAIYPPGDGDLESKVRQMTMAYTAFFENCIRKYPEQWLWTHRRWKI